MSNELENYRIQLQQVEAALVAEPNNEELLKLKEDLLEVIVLQEILEETKNSSTSNEQKSAAEKISWKVGDRCVAPTKNGQMHVAVIDGISQDKVAITFTSNGVKHMVRLSELGLAPAEEKPKNYIFKTSNSKGTGPKNKEWIIERERRKLRAQKKEQRRKEIDNVKEQQKSKWQQFNAKAVTKNIKDTNEYERPLGYRLILPVARGIKRVAASSSAPDGPRANAERTTMISSRMNLSFGSTSRGNMESLF